MQISDLEQRFTYHAPNEEQIKKYEAIRIAAKGFGKFLLDVTPTSREQSLAMNNLEQVVFWSNAAIARNKGDEDGSI